MRYDLTWFWNLFPLWPRRYLMKELVKCNYANILYHQTCHQGKKGQGRSLLDGFTSRFFILFYLFILIFFWRGGGLLLIVSSILKIAFVKDGTTSRFVGIKSDATVLSTRLCVC